MHQRKGEEDGGKDAEGERTKESGEKSLRKEEDRTEEEEEGGKLKGMIRAERKEGSGRRRTERER